MFQTSHLVTMCFCSCPLSPGSCLLLLHDTHLVLKMLATIYQMSDSGRPTTPLRVPDEGSEMRERFTRSVALRPSEGGIPIIKSESRNGKSKKGSTGRRSSASVESKARRRMTPTVEYAGYKDMISRLQEEATEAIRTRTREVVERRMSSSSMSSENDFSPQQYDEDERQDELPFLKSPFFHGFNSTTKEPKSKYYAVR
jgi:hypothetical protein